MIECFHVFYLIHLVALEEHSSVFGLEEGGAVLDLLSLGAGVHLSLGEASDPGAGLHDVGEGLPVGDPVALAEEVEVDGWLSLRLVHLAVREAESVGSKSASAVVEATLRQ